MVAEYAGLVNTLAQADALAGATTQKRRFQHYLVHKCGLHASAVAPLGAARFTGGTDGSGLLWAVDL
jgi:hypothetical protein